MPLFFNNIRIFCHYKTFKCFSYNRLWTNCPNQSNNSLRQSGKGAGEVKSDGPRKRSTDRSGRRGWRGSVKSNKKAIKKGNLGILGSYGLSWEMFDSKRVEKFASVLLLTWVQSLMLCGDKKEWEECLQIRIRHARISLSSTQEKKIQKTKQCVNCSSED